MPPPAGAARSGLRRKGALLFIAVSAYVVGGAALLAWHVLAGNADPRAGPALAVAAVAAGLGLAVFGAFLTLFLGRLSGDLARVQERALQVAAGLRGAPLGIGRDDEVGQLACAVDKMAADLQARESEIAAARLEQFHAERMMLLGGIAEGVAHELGNPAAAIAAMAMEVQAARRACRPPECDAAELARLAQRLASMTRRLAAVAGLRPGPPGAVSLNEVIEGLLALVALEPRFRRIEIVQELDPGVPAAWLCEDDLARLLTHLLVNAAEAFEEANRERPFIRVVTRAYATRPILEVADNGRGMDAATAARAFEPLFTTKPAGRGNGLGLDACRRIVERHGGEIAIESAPGRGTRVRCTFVAATEAAARGP